MKKIFAALTVAFTIMVGNVSEASEITSEQREKIFQEIKQDKTESETRIEAEMFESVFDWFIVPIVQDGMNKDDISDILHLFIIGEYDVLKADNDTIFYRCFGYPGAMLVCKSAGETEHDPLKVLSLYYTTPENKEESAYTSWLLMAFVGSISTDLDVRALMSELTKEGSSGSVVKYGFKFSIRGEGNLNVLTVTRFNENSAP